MVSKNKHGSKVSFTESCYSLLKKIPKGKVTTYKALAHALGCRAYRAVGTAMANNTCIPEIPCHRVINSSGSLGGYAKGLPAKIKLLKSEGVKIENNKISLKEFEHKF